MSTGFTRRSERFRGKQVARPIALSTFLRHIGAGCPERLAALQLSPKAGA